LSLPTLLLLLPAPSLAYLMTWKTDHVAAALLPPLLLLLPPSLAFLIS
jgi:hypothetical protein